MATVAPCFFFFTSNSSSLFGSKTLRVAPNFSQPGLVEHLDTVSPRRSDRAYDNGRRQPDAREREDESRSSRSFSPTRSGAERCGAEQRRGRTGGGAKGDGLSLSEMPCPLSLASRARPGLVSFVLGYLPAGIIPPSRWLLIRPALSNAIRRGVSGSCYVAALAREKISRRTLLRFRASSRAVFFPRPRTRAASFIHARVSPRR